MDQCYLAVLAALIISLLLWSGSLIANHQVADGHCFVNNNKNKNKKIETHAAVLEAPSIREAEIVADLYAYTQRMQDLNSAARIKEYQALNRSSLNCQTKQACLRLALLLSGLEPTLTDYDRARNLLNAVLDESPGPLLKGYICSARDALKRNERQRTQLQTMHQNIMMMETQNHKLRDKVKALELELDDLKMKIEALTSIEQSLKNREQEQ